MAVEIFYVIVLNMSVLVLIAQLLTRLKVVRVIVQTQERTIKSQIILVLIFSALGIFTSVSGYEYNGAIVNVRTIAVASGAILFGPVVGLLSALITSVHRLTLVGSDVTALACSISTLITGVVTSYYFVKYRYNKKYLNVFIMIIVLQTIEMVMIIMLANPISEGLQIVMVIGFPVIIINSLGVLLFISVFESGYLTQEYYLAQKVELVLEIAQSCLPYLRKGINDQDSLSVAVKIILYKSSAHLVAITNTEDVISLRSKSHKVKEADVYDFLVKLKKGYSGTPYVLSYGQHNYIGAPLYEYNKIIGYLIMILPLNQLILQTKIQVIDGLSKIMSTQLELSYIDRSKELLKKTEFEALQAQINPHFLFNILNTCIALSREDSAKTRTVLTDLSIYFRNILNQKEYFIPLNKELEYLSNYMALEKARFEDRVIFSISNNVNDDIKVPKFIIQPIVENSIKHGIASSGSGQIDIVINKKGNYLIIKINDNGVGVDKAVIDKLYDGTIDTKKIGLANVHERLKLSYGNEYGLEFIATKSKYTTVLIKIPIEEG